MNTTKLCIGLLFMKISLCAESCLEIILSDRWCLSGVYRLLNKNNETYDVFCDFDGAIGYTYFSSLITVQFNVSKHYSIRSHAKIRYYDPGLKTQGEVTVSQISRFQSEELGFFHNNFTKYNYPTLKEKYSYLYLGFVPKALVRRGEIQGYKAGTQEYKFKNCDGNPNCYFTFYFGTNITLPNKAGNTLSKGWMTSATELKRNDYMDAHFYFPVEIHMGGCGALTTTPGIRGIKGSLGLPFEIPPACLTNPCLNSGVCLDNGTVYECSCQSAFYGPNCQYGRVPVTSTEVITPSRKDITEISATAANMQQRLTCSCDCSEDRLKWAYLSSGNFTRDEIRVLLKDDLEKLRKELKIDSRKTNYYYRTHHSASDNRTSAVSTGVVGVILLCVPIIVIVTTDLMSFKDYALNKK